MVQGRGHKLRPLGFMPRKSAAIINDLSKQLSTSDQPGDSYQVKEPGPNPPTAGDVKKRMVIKITTNAEDILDSLITIASHGHYQAAQYLLDEMNRISLEQQQEGGRSIGEVLLPAVRFLAAKYREQKTNAAEMQSDADEAVLTPLDESAIAAQ
jgi:hypothetical protein